MGMWTDFKVSSSYVPKKYFNSYSELYFLLWKQYEPHFEYHIYHMYLDRQAWANSIDPDERLQNAASHLGLHCLPLIQQFLDTTSGSELCWFRF